MSFYRGSSKNWINFQWKSLLFIGAILAQAIIMAFPRLVEARPIAAAYPTVTINPSSVMIGEDFSFTATFDNTDADPGYGPFIDLVFPYTGEDGDDGIEYYSSSYLGSALEDDIQFFPDQGGGWGCVSHPWLRNTSGAYVDVCGNAGDQFVSIRLPFGSYTANQPPLDVTINAHLSNLADLTPDLQIYARGGFMFGETPEDDFCCGDTPYARPNTTISTSWPGSAVTPQVLTFDKAYIGPGNTEDETSSGPNFPRKYTLTLDIATGQTLTNIDFQDLLPDNVQFIGIDIANTTPGYSVISLPSTTDPGGTFYIRYASGTGTVVVTLDFYIPELYDQDGDTFFDDPVIDPSSGDDVTSDNIAWVDASWDPFDSRDGITPVSSDATCPSCVPLHSLEDKSIAIQKSLAVISGGVGLDNDPAPGAILEYTIVFQVSDYFTFDDLVVTDTISDGQHVLDSSAFVPSLTIVGNPSNYSNNFNSANYSVVCDYTVDLLDPARDGSECFAYTAPPPPVKTGQTTLIFNVSDQLGGNGRMVGGCVNPAGGMVTPCNYNPVGDSGAGPTTATIVFRTEVLDQFVDTYPSGDSSVDQGDVFNDSVNVTGDILDNTSWLMIGSESDIAVASDSIGRETLGKSIYAINNVTNSLLWERDALGRVRIKPGDKLTYNLTYDLLTSDVEELTFDDYFPLPVFDVLDPDVDGLAGPSWSFSAAGGIPAPGVVTLKLPGDSFYQYMTDGLSGGTGTLTASLNNNPPTQAPKIVASGTDNKINIYYADFDDTRNQSTTVDLLFSLIVSDDPFADGLFLTNMAHAFEGSTNAGTSSSDAIIQFVLTEPVLVSTKGIVYTDNPNAVFDPVDVGPGTVTFLAPGDAAVPPRWTGTINSTGLDANPIDSNLSGVDAGDTLTFAIIIENQGNSINGAFDIMLQDTLDSAYYQIPVTGLNLQIYYGDGSGPIPYRAVDLSCTVDPAANNDICGEELFNNGLELIDPVGAGVCSSHDPNNGNNVILITYDLEIKPDVTPGQAVNTATVFNFAGSEGGPNHLDGVNPLEDDATADVIGGLEKTLDETEYNITTNPLGTNLTEEVVIGELVTYTLTATIPEGNVPNARLEDHLDGGLAFVSCDSVLITADTGVVTDLPDTDFSGVCAATEAAGISNAGQDIVFSLGNITNNDRDDNQETIAITYQVVVINATGNQGGGTTLLDNAAEYLMNEGSGDVSLGTADADDVIVIEPALDITKTAVPTSGDYGDTISYTIDLDYGAGSETTAYDIVLEDVIPAGMTYVNSTLVCSVAGGLAVPDVCSESGGTITVEWQGLAKPYESGYSATINFDVTLDLSVSPGDVITNTAEVTWTSLPGDEVTIPRSTYNALAVERTGDLAGPGTTANDYLASDGADVTIFSPTADKIITGTNHTFTTGTNVAVGEQVSYSSSFTIPEGTSTAAVLVDTLDQGLAFLSCDDVYVTEVVSNSLTTTGIFDCSSVTFSNVGTGPANLGRRMTLDLGVVTNNDNNNATDESITVEYTVVVINGGSNDRGDNRNNAASWNWSGGSTSDSADNVTIVEPGFVVTKTALPTTGDFGDTITFIIDLDPSAASNVNAYDVVLTDIIPSDMTYVASSLSCTPAGGLAVPDTCAESSGTITVEWLGLLKPFEITHSATITFQATLDITVTPGEVITNTADLTWTSLPGDIGTAQSTYNPLSVERTGDTGDIGGAVNDYLASDGADVTVFSPTGTKDVINTNQAFTTLYDVAIGETVTYQADFIIPEGTSSAAQLVDTLEPGLAFVSCDDVSFVGSLTTTTSFDCSSASFSNYPNSDPENQGRRMVIDLGVVTNNDTNNATDESITVEYTVVVLNSSDANRGDTPTNSAAWTWSGGTTTESAPDLLILEPGLEVIKTVNPGSGDAGDTIRYTMLLRHTGVSNVNAYEVSLTDAIPTKSTYVNSSLTCTPAGGLAAPLTCTETAGVINVGWSGILEPFETGHSATIEFDVVLDDTVNPTEIINNNADLVWTSLPTDVDTAQSTYNPLSVERTGDIGDIGGAVNDYSAADDIDVTVPALGINKTTTPLNYTIGETINYDIDVTLAEGTTNGLIVIDNLPAGLAYSSHSVDSTLFNGILDPTPVETIVSGSGGSLSLDFGNTLTNSDNISSNNTFTVSITAQVLNIASNVDGVSLRNTVTVQHDDGPDVSDFIDISIIEPLLTIAKTVDDDTPSLSQTITYTLEIAHDLDGSGDDSQATAYNVEVADTLPSGLSNLTNLNTSSTGNCATGIDSSASTGSVLNVSIDSIPYSLPAPGCVVTITFDATLDSPPTPPAPAVGSTIDNTGRILWTSTAVINAETREGDGVLGNVDDYEDDDTQTITITNPELRVSKTDGVTEYIPGSSVTYTIVVENIGNEGVLNALVEDDLPLETAPPNNVMVSTWDWVCSGSTGGASGCDGSAALAGDFSDLVNLPAGSSITYQVTTNILSSATGNLENTVTISMPAGVLEPTPDDNTATDIDGQDSHSDLAVDKDDGVTIISPSTTITYTIQVDNLSPSDVTGATFEDLIPADIVSWAWTCVHAGGASGCDPAASNSSDFTDIVNLPAGSTITYTVVADVSAAASGTLTNTATINVPAGVTDDDLSNNTDDDVDGFAVHDKDLVSQLHGVTTLPDVAIGEILTYEVTLTVPPGSMTNTHLIDTLDLGLAFVSCESISAGSLTTSIPGGFASICAAPGVNDLPGGSPDNDGRQVDFNFGTLANPNPPGGATIDLVIRYQVVVLDSLGNQSGSTPLLVNDAEWVWDSGRLDDQADGVNILEPDLVIIKDAAPTVLYPGQITTFTLVVEHLPGSQTSAFDLELTDIIPIDLIYQAPVRHVSGQVPTVIDDSGAPTIIIQWDEFLNNGTNSVLEIDVMLDPAFRQTKRNQSITNDSSLSWTSLPGDFSAAQSIHNTLSTERFYDPLSNVNIYGIGDGATIRIPALPDTGFAPGKVTDLPLQKESQEYGDLDGLRVEIPRLGISVPVVSVPISEQGWDLTWLWNQAGWLEGTAYPSWYGNTVITGHAYLPSGLPGPFVRLNELSWGDEILLYANGLKYTYQVRITDLVAADDYRILQHKDQDWMTLFTCKEFNDRLGSYNWRQVVQAVMIDVEEIE